MIIVVVMAWIDYTTNVGLPTFDYALTPRAKRIINGKIQEAIKNNDETELVRLLVDGVKLHEEDFQAPYKDIAWRFFGNVAGTLTGLNGGYAVIATKKMFSMYLKNVENDPMTEKKILKMFSIPEEELDVIEDKIEVGFLEEYVKTLERKIIIIKRSGKKNKRRVETVEEVRERIQKDAPKRFKKFLCTEHKVEITPCITHHV